MEGPLGKSKSTMNVLTTQANIMIGALATMRVDLGCDHCPKGDRRTKKENRELASYDLEERPTTVSLLTHLTYGERQ